MARIQFTGFSPDSQALAYTMILAQTQTDEIHLTSWIADVDGNHKVEVTEAYLNTYTEESSGKMFMGLLPNWDRVVLKHPDSESYENPGNMYVAAIDGTNLVFLDGDIVDDNAIISPDGSQIVYLHADLDNNEVAELRTIGVDGTDKKTLISWNLQSDSESLAVGFPLAWVQISQ